MFKNISEDIKLAKLSYLLEIIRLRKTDEKIKAFNKIKKMKISKEMGLKILESTTLDYDSKQSEETFNISLIGLCLENYYDEYSNVIKEIFEKLSDDTKYKTLTMISYINKESAVRLYSYLVVNYCSKVEDLPLGTLQENDKNYEYLFPELYKAFSFNVKRNNILVLLNDFINKGIVKVDDLKRNKKFLQREICKILKEAINYKFEKKENFMNNEDYINLRFFLESSINIEYYISSRESKKLIDKLFTKRDNQLKLFILENYIKKKRKIDNINLNYIARDKLSRYPLYSLLMYYNLERLMPEKYANTKALAESDLYLNYAISTSYSEYPTDMVFYKEIVHNNYKYFVFRFKVKSLYKNSIKDYTTNYLVDISGIKKYKDIYVTNNFVGISGGYNVDIDPSLIEHNSNKLMVIKESKSIENDIYNLLPKKIEIPKIEINIDKNIKPTIKSKQKKFKIFSFKTLFLLQFIIIISLFAILISYINGYNLLNLDVKDKSIETKNETQIYKKTTYSEVENLTEIDGHDIFNKDEKEYYVLLFSKKDSSEYYTYISYLMNNNYKFYYVDLNKEENKFLYENNDLNFTLKTDRLLKVNDREFEFFVDEKNNILKELRTEANIVRVNNEKNEDNLKEVDNKVE